MGTGCSKQSKSSSIENKSQENPIFKISNGALLTQPESFSQGHSVKEDLTFSKEDIQNIYNFDPNIIGKGEFGHVRTASLKCCPRKKFAIKTISKEKVKSNMNMIINEVEILKKCDHPNIVKFYETYQDQKFLHLVLQYCRGGQLQQSRTSQYIFRQKTETGIKKVNIYTEAQAKDIMAKILSSVKYMHQIGIVHRDLKLENFVFNEKSENNYELKLIDFGLSEKFSNDSDQFKSIAGTYMYIAPEILEQNGYNKACDLWSCGVILYYLLSGQYPFFTNNKDELFAMIKKGKFEFKGELWKKMSKEVKDLISKMLVVDDKQRITATDALTHVWFKSLKAKQITDLKKQEKNLINNLYEVPIMPTLKYQAYKLMVGLLDEEDMRQIREQFRLIDYDQDGLISFQDLQQCQQFCKDKEKLSLEQIQETINKITSNCESKHYITYTTFIIAIIGRQKQIIQKNINVIFNLFDIDHTGKVTKENLIMSLAREGRKLQTEDITSIIEQVDFNNNQFISKNEFMNMMKYDNLAEMREQFLKRQQQKLENDCQLDKSYADEGTDAIISNRMKQYLCCTIYNKNQKNLIGNKQPISHQQIKQNNRKGSICYSFDEEFEQKLIEDEYMQKFDQNNTQKNNQKEQILQQLIKRQSQMSNGTIKSNGFSLNANFQNHQNNNNTGFASPQKISQFNHNFNSHSKHQSSNSSGSSHDIHNIEKSQEKQQQQQQQKKQVPQKVRTC